MDIAAVSVISSASVGGLGVLVPVGMKLLERRHTRSDWLRDRRAETYGRVFSIVARYQRRRDVAVPTEPEMAEVATMLSLWGSIRVRDLFDVYWDASEDTVEEAQAIDELLTQIRQELHNDRS